MPALPERANRLFQLMSPLPTSVRSTVSPKFCGPPGVMVGRFFSHFQNVVGNPALFQGRDPLQFAAECILDVAKLQGWGSQQRQSTTQTGRGSFFQTNSDLWDDQAMEDIMRRGLL